MRRRTNERPSGIAVLGVLFFVMAVVMALGSLSVMLLGGVGVVGGVMFGGESATMVSEEIVLVGVMALVLAGLQVVVGFGLMTQQRWGWWLAMVVTVLTAVFGAFILFGGNPFCGTAVLMVPGAIGLYLLQPSVRKQFTHTAESEGWS